MPKGFTLIEVLVTVLIIGILTSIALPQYQKAVYRAHFAKMVTASDAIYNAQIIYHDTYNKYAETMEELDITLPDTENINCSASYGGWTVLCSLRMPNKGTIAILEQYLSGENAACCTYKDNNYAGAFLCETHMNTTSWFNGCGDDGYCHCYKRQ